MIEGMQPSVGEIELARKLFVGACDFVWGATSAQNLPPENLNEVALSAVPMLVNPHWSTH